MPPRGDLQWYQALVSGLILFPRYLPRKAHPETGDAKAGGGMSRSEIGRCSRLIGATPFFLGR
jgi:hypothetical protein